MIDISAKQQLEMVVFFSWFLFFSATGPGRIDRSLADRPEGVEGQRRRGKSSGRAGESTIVGPSISFFFPFFSQFFPRFFVALWFRRPTLKKIEINKKDLVVLFFKMRY